MQHRPPAPSGIRHRRPIRRTLNPKGAARPEDHHDQNCPRRFPVVRPPHRIAATACADVASHAATLKDIEQTFGFVPTFMTQQPKAGFEGAWRQLKELEFSENTVLPPKVKALIGLAVVAQIPCSYCIWADALGAKQAGATDEEIREAVAIAATERYWSTMLNGLQTDLDNFKAEFSRVEGAEAAE
jgi:AhpD family alkylhydroperoxidase